MHYFSAFLKLPSVAPSVITLRKGEVLFEQGEQADTAFLLLDGSMKLTGEGDDWVFNEPVLAPGEVIGEKALVHEGAYQRRFGAEALMVCQLLEISRKSFLKWNKECPALMVDIVSFLVAGFLRRQDNANYLINALRPTEPLRRVVSVLAYWSRSAMNRQTPEFSIALLFDYLDMDRDSLTKILSQLASLGVLEFLGADKFRLKNRDLLVGLLSSFEQKAA